MSFLSRMMPLGSFLVRVVVLVPALAVLSGCRQEPVTVYNIPKETAPATDPALAASPHGGGMGSPHGSMGGAPQVRFETPSGWTEQGAAGMNLASFSAPGEAGTVEVSVLALPVGAGREMGINILRERVGLPGLDAAGLAALAETVGIASGEGQLYDMATDPAAAQPARLVLGVFEEGPLLWFIRMTGAPADVEAQKPAMLGFLKTLALEAPGTPAAAASVPAPATSMAAANPPANPAADLPSWEVPEGWQSQPAPNMVMAKFTAGPAGQEVEVAVSVFPGDVGGAAANVNRWRAQMGLGTPLPEDQALALLTPITLADGEGQLVEIDGQRGGQSILMIGAIVPRDGRTWFYKLTGPSDAALAEKDALLKFLKSARHPQP